MSADTLPGLSREQARTLRGVSIRTLRAELARGLRQDLPAIARAYALHPPSKLVRGVHALINRRLSRTYPRKRFVVVGSWRRGKKNPRDVDVLTNQNLLQLDLSVCGEVLAVYACGEKKLSAIIGVVHRDKYYRVPLDVFYANLSQWGTALLHHTGPYEFNIQLRVHARARGYKLNQYGIEDAAGVHWNFRTESAVGRFLGKSIPRPESR